MDGMLPTKAPAIDRLKGIRWIIGILFFGAVSSFLLNLGLYKLTSEEVMRPTISKTLSILFQREGAEKLIPAINYLNELSRHQTDIDTIQKAAGELDQQKIEAELAGMTPEQSKKYMEEKFAGPLYSSSRVVESLKAVDPNTKIEAENLDLLRIATIDTHNALGRLLKYQGVIIGVLLLVLLLLGKKWNKLTSPSMLILLAALPGYLFASYLNPLVENFLKPYLGAIANDVTFTDLSKEVIAQALVVLRESYFLPVLISFCLLVLGYLLGWLTNRKQPKYKFK